MLDLLRKNTRTFGIYFMFAAIIVVFGFTFGAISPDQACGGQPGVMAQADLVKVGDAKIDTALVQIAMAISEDAPPPKSKKSDRDYRMTRFRNLGLIGPMSGGAFSRIGEDVHPVSFVKFTDDLIETKLVSNYAKSLGMAVSDKELNQRLALFVSNFRDEKTGRFDPDGFGNWLGRNAMSSTRFENFVRDEILREKVIQMLVGEVAVTDAELELAHRLGNEKVGVEAIVVDATSARALVPVSPTEVGEWLAANGEKVASEYEARKATEFTTPKNWKLRGIRFDAPDLSLAADDDQKAGLEEERKEIRAKAEGVLSELKAKLAEPGVDEEGNPVPPTRIFADLAAAHSDDTVSKAMGGAMKASGYTEAELGRPPFGPAVKDAVTTAAVGAPLELVESAGAFWILQVDAVEPERVDALEAVREKLAKSLIQEERAETFKTSLADEVLAEAKKQADKGLDAVATMLNEKYGAEAGKGLSVRQVMAFPRLMENQTPFLFSLGGRSAGLVRDAFGASAESPVLPAVYTVEPMGRLVVARFKEKTEAEPMEADVREENRKALTFERQRALYRGWYEDMLAKKIAGASVEFTSAFERERKNAEEAFVKSGGVLPMSTTVAATPAEAPAAN
jgi:hypothetical protein